MTRPSRPWMMFYPSDWRADPKLRCCSIAARGLWIELIALMHESERYGFLLVNGKQPSERKLASLVGISIVDLSSLLTELDEEGVFSRDREGVIYSRRMKNDEKRAQNARKNGKRGGNPTLTKHSENPASDNLEVKPEDNGGDKPQSPESIYQSNSVSNDTDANGVEAIDPVKELIDSGIKVLAAGNIAEKPARSIIGQWRKKYGDEATALAIGSASGRDLSQPLEWIAKRLQTRADDGRSPGGVKPKSHADVVLERQRLEEAHRTRTETQRRAGANQ
jgi:hypothetical protein